MKNFLIFFVFILISLNGLSQKNEGYVRFAMQYSDSELSKEEMAVMPTESEMWFKGDRMKLQMPMGMGLQSSILIFNEEVHLLLDLMGNKMAIKTNKNEIQNDSKKAKRF